MSRTVTATEAKLKFGEILADVSHGKNCVVIEKQGKEVAALIPKEDYEILLRFQESEQRLSRREALRQLIEWRDRLPPPDPNAPSAVEIIRELRHGRRF